jgi:hypothetical protein
MDSDAASCEVDAVALGWEALHEVAVSAAHGLEYLNRAATPG